MISKVAYAAISILSFGLISSPQLPSSQLCAGIGGLWFCGGSSSVGEAAEQHLNCDCHCGTEVGSCNVTASIAKPVGASYSWSHTTVLALALVAEIACVIAFRYRHIIARLRAANTPAIVDNEHSTTGNVQAPGSSSDMLHQRPDIVLRARNALAASRK